MNLMAQYDTTEVGPVEQETFLVGAIVPFGQGEFKIAYSKAEQDGTLLGVNLGGSGADQLALGYVYNVSKRTALYGHYSIIKNDGIAAFAIPGGSGSAQNNDSKGFELGVRHSF